MIHWPQLNPWTLDQDLCHCVTSDQFFGPLDQISLDPWPRPSERLNIEWWFFISRCCPSSGSQWWKAGEKASLWLVASESATLLFKTCFLVWRLLTKSAPLRFLHDATIHLRFYLSSKTFTAFLSHLCHVLSQFMTLFYLILVSCDRRMTQEKVATEILCCLKSGEDGKQGKWIYPQCTF